MRQDIFDPKLQDGYKLKSAINLIQKQDQVIADQATRIAYEQEYISKLREDISVTLELLRKADDALHSNHANVWGL